MRGLSGSFSLSPLAGTIFDAGDGTVVDGTVFDVTFAAGIGSASSGNSTIFGYDIGSSNGLLTFITGSNADNSTTLAGLSDTGIQVVGGAGKTDEKIWTVTFSGSGLALTDEISFSITHEDTGSPFFWMDDFSVTAIPEPASLALMGLGGLLMLRRRRA